MKVNDLKVTDGRIRRGLANKKAIIAAAKILFMEKDYNEVTTEEISIKAGVGHGTLYNHFNGKDDILKYFIDEISSDFDRVLFLPYEPQNINEIEQRISEDILYLFKLAQKHKDVMQVAYRAMGYSDTIKEYWDHVFYKYINKAFEDYYYSFKKGFTRKDLSLNVVSKSIVYLIKEFFWDIVMDKEEDIIGISKDMVSLYLYGAYHRE